MVATNPLAQGKPTPQQPAEGEEYMSAEQRAYFRNILLEWKQSLLHEVATTWRWPASASPA
jgi:DnaK suppressor protein